MKQLQNAELRLKMHNMSAVIADWKNVQTV